LYYAEKYDDHEPPPEVGAVRRLAFRYAASRDAGDADLRSRPIAVSPAQYRENLAGVAARDDWDELADPTAREQFLRGRDCHGVAHKVLGGDPPTPTLVSPGDPPDRGVWEPQRVRAVGLAKALAWERDETEPVPRALVEYPAHGVVRTVRLTTRNRGLYRRTLWTVRSTSGVPPRLRDTGKCDSCDYRTRCGTKTRSLKSLLGL
jgi:CRISPR-associated exonuclease Cas4